MRTILPLKKRQQSKHSLFFKQCLNFRYLLIVIALLAFVHTKAQVSTYYTWSQSSATYLPGVSTTSSTPANIFSTSWDDVAYTGYTLPFSFTFNGTAYSNIGVDADGWITFSNGVPLMSGQGAGGSWVSFSDHTGVYLNGNANNNGFAAFNCDIYDQAFATFTGNRTIGSTAITGVSSTANLQIGTRLVGTGISDGTVITNISGTTVTMSANSFANNSTSITPRASIYAFIRNSAPNRQFIIQWTQAKRYSGLGTENINFQIILNEANGDATLQTIQSVYGVCTTSDGLTLNVQVGLRGASATDFNARSGNAWASTTAATANTDKIRFSNTINPASGLTFTWSPCTMAPGTPGSISGPAPVCSNTPSTYSITAVPGATSYNWSYSGGGATFTPSAITSSPTVSINFGTAPVSGTLSVTATNICGTNATASTLPITVNAVPTAGISYPAVNYCSNTSGTIAVTQTGTTGGTYTASPAGLSINTSTGAITPASCSLGTYTVTYTFTNGTCPNTTTTTVSINAIPVATGSATPAIICSGGNSQLSVTAGSAGYTVNPIAYSSLAPSGSPTNIFNIYTDEAISAAIAIPFTFTFYGQAITQFYASSNGYIQLQSGPFNSFTPQTLPNAASPNNVIALAWDDLVVDPTTLPGSNIRYFINGVSPNRVVVIDFVKLSFYGSPNVGNMTGQIRLYESDNRIEVAAGTVNDAGQLDSKTLGIENNTGTIGLTPAGRNNAVWNLVSSEAWAFYPVNYTYLWSPSTFLSSTTISNPVATGVTATTNYSVQVTNTVSGCAASVSVPVTISAPLNGTYTVGAGGNYTTLTAAVNAYNTICISGPVTFSLIDNLYSSSETFPISINSNAYQSAVNTLTIRPATGISATISGAVANDALVKISGKYISINGSNNNSTTRNLSLTNTSATVPTVVLLGSVSNTAPVTNVAIKNCIITNGVNTSSAVVVSSNVVATAGYFSNDTIQNNVVQKAYIGIYCIGVNGSGNGNGLKILSNVLNSTGANALSIAGIYAQDIDGVTIQYNQIGNFTGTDSYDDKGIWLATGVKNSSILNNKVTNLNYTGGFGYGAYGICLTTGVANANILVANNMIANISGDGFDFTSATYGLDNPVGIMLFTTQSGIKLYFNSINLGTAGFTNTLNSANAISAGIRLHTGSTADIRNNIVVNNLGRTGVATTGYGAIGILAATNNTQFTTINYNDYSIAPSGSIAKYFGQINTTGQTTLAGWKGASAGEANGINVTPVFAAATDLHLSPAASNLLMNNTGTPIPAITIDYDTTTRNGLTPDIGADEFLAPNTGSWV
ncbi:MAG: hypothetical protein ABIT58_03045, partial [Ferruginibacter sp.]